MGPVTDVRFPDPCPPPSRDIRDPLRGCKPISPISSGRQVTCLRQRGRTPNTSAPAMPAGRTNAVARDRGHLQTGLAFGRGRGHLVRAARRQHAQDAGRPLRAGPEDEGAQPQLRQQRGVVQEDVHKHFGVLRQDNRETGLLSPSPRHGRRPWPWVPLWHERQHRLRSEPRRSPGAHPPEQWPRPRPRPETGSQPEQCPQLGVNMGPTEGEE